MTAEGTVQHWKTARAITLGLAMLFMTHGHSSAGGLLPTALPKTSKLALPVAVFGEDGRQPLPRHLNDLAHSVGLVISGTEKTVCSGFCVGRRTVATAAHCLFRTAGERKPDLSSFSFAVGSPGDRRVSAIEGHRSGNYHQHVSAGTASLNIAPPIEATNDWALIRLERPICRKHSLLVTEASPLTISKIAARARLFNVAYHGDFKNWRLAVSRPCSAKGWLSSNLRQQIEREFSDTSALVLHDCDTGPGSSGSPLLALSDDNSLRVVAMNVGTYNQTRYMITGRSVKHRYKPATVANTAISGSAFSDHIMSFARADILSDPSSIKRLQRSLRVAGFDAGPVDGMYGERTRAAVDQFARENGRAGPVLVTPLLLQKIEAWKPR